MYDSNYQMMEMTKILWAKEERIKELENKIKELTSEDDRGNYGQKS